MTALNNPIVVAPWPPHLSMYGIVPAHASSLTDASGEYVDYIGQVYWDGEAASKVVSSAGGGVLFRTGAVTWANSASRYTVSIQDVDATGVGDPGRGDGTDDVYKTLVQGTDTLTANTATTVSFGTGTKTIAHGDLVAIRFAFTTVGGADLVNISNQTNNYSGAFPFVTTFLGGAISYTQTRYPNVAILADDGTVGWLAGATLIDTITQRAFDSGTASADEYGSIFQLPYACDICGLCFVGRCNGVSGGSFKGILYSDPLGTPVKEKTTFTAKEDQISTNSTNSLWMMMFASAFTISANTNYALTLQPQDATGDITVYEYAVSTTGMKTFRGGGGTWSKGTRLNDTGALAQTTTSVMTVGALVSNIATGGGAAGMQYRNVMRGNLG